MINRYSCVGVWKDDRVEIIPNEAQITTNPQNTVFDAKRLIGRKYHDQIVQNDLKHWPFKLVADEHDNPIIQVQYMGETRNFTCGKCIFKQ